MQKLNTNKYLISKMERRAKLRAIKQIYSDISTLRSYVPAVDVTLQYGKQIILPEIFNEQKKTMTNVIKSQRLQQKGSLANLILCSENKDPMELSTQEISFQKYKGSPYKNKYLLTQGQQPDLKKQDIKIHKNRIITMPSQLSRLKQQLKDLPSVGLSPKRLNRPSIQRQSRVSTNPQQYDIQLVIKNRSQMRISRSNMYESVQLDQKEFRSQTNRKDKQVNRYFTNDKRDRHNSDFDHSFQQRRSSYLQNIRAIIEKSREQVQPIIKYLTEVDIERMKKAEQKLKRFMDYQEPPSEGILKMLQEIQQIQDKEQLLIKMEVKRQAKDSFGLNFKHNLDSQIDMHKKRLKKFIQGKKQFKIDMVKLNTVKAHVIKKQKHINKLLQTQQQREKVINKNQKTSSSQITCQRCQ